MTGVQRAVTMGCLVLGTRGIKARHRHLLRDLLQLLPHGKLGSKLATDEGLRGVLQVWRTSPKPARAGTERGRAPRAQLCEDGDCGAALLLDARDPRRLYLWAANTPDGPSAMFQVVNIHTVAELKLGGSFTVVHVGGLQSADDVARSRATGAELRQWYTGLMHGLASPSPETLYARLTA